MRRTSSRRSIRLHAGQNVRYADVIENSTVMMSRHLDTSTETKVSVEDPVVPLERNLYGYPVAGLLWERQFEKSLLKYVGKKFQLGNVSSVTEKRLFLSVYVDDIKLAEKNRTLIRLGKFP